MQGLLPHFASNEHKGHQFKVNEQLNMSGARVQSTQRSHVNLSTMPATPPAFHTSPYTSSLLITAALPAAPLPSAARSVFHCCCQWCCCFHGSELASLVRACPADA
eukprot:1158085-Pelagomonas_calceolata.AAC.9